MGRPALRRALSAARPLERDVRHRPLDLTAQRFFTLVCCLAGLPGVGGLTRVGGVGTVGTVQEAFTRFVGEPGIGTVSGAAIALGQAVLFVRPGATDADDARLGVTRTETVGPLEFASRLLGALRQPPAAPAAGQRVRLVAEGLGVSLVVPEAAVPTPKPAAAPPADPARLRGIADRALSALTGATVPPLLRGVAGELTAGLLRTQPLPPAEAIASRLQSAGVDSLGALLERDPEALHRDALGGTSGAELSSLVDKAESDAHKIATAVAQSLAQLRDRDVAARADLADAATRAALVKVLRKQLGDAAPSAAALDALVLAAAQRSP